MLVVADEAAVLEDPDEGALDYPAPWQHLEAFRVCTLADDLERDVRHVGGPVHEATDIAAIGEDMGDKRVALTGCLERQLAAVAVLDIDIVDADGEKPAIGVG